MSQEVTVQVNSAEEVAYKLCLKILGQLPKSEEEILTTYEKCLKVVRGYSYQDLTQE